MQVADGVEWLRLPMPFSPGHVNAYLIDDGEGWLLVDAGLNDRATEGAWSDLLRESLRGRTISRILVTHWHHDHLGMAGRLAQRFDAPLLLGAAEHDRAVRELGLTDAERGAGERAFLLAHGADPARLEAWIEEGLQGYARIAPLPSDVLRLPDDGMLAVGGVELEIVTVRGHSPGSTTLRDAERNLFFAADQLSTDLVPSIGVLSDTPDADPYADFLATTEAVVRRLPADTLVLPGHEEAFAGAADVFDRIVVRHERACHRVLAAATGEGRTAGELAAVLTRTDPGATWYGFVVSRAIAYARYLTGRGLMTRTEHDGRSLFTAVPGAAEETRS